MKKITIELSSEIESEVDETFATMQKARDFICALEEFRMWIRGEIKYQEGETISKEVVQDKFYEIINSHNIEL